MHESLSDSTDPKSNSCVETYTECDSSANQSTPSLMSMHDRDHRYSSNASNGFLRRHFLPLLCFTLHVALVLFNIALLFTGLKSWEHRIAFSLDRQTTVSFWATAITTGFGTIYTSILVFLTQKLAMRRNIQLHQTLTATHDSIFAWAGLGSAVATLYNQLAVPASVFGSLNVAGYLGCISILHIAIPAFISVETFDTTVAVTARTFGIPDFHNSTSVISTGAFMMEYPPDFLRWRGIFEDSQMLGLFNSSLYEVLQNVTPGNGKAQVSATGINITCGYLPAVIQNNFEGYLNASLGNIQTTVLENLHPNMVSVIQDTTSNIFIHNFSSVNNSSSYSAEHLAVENPNSIIIYTTNVVIDSEGHQGSPIVLEEQYPSLSGEMVPLNLGISQIQFLQCSKSLVPQFGTVDTQFNTLNSASLQPSLHKNNSKWTTSVNLDFTPQDSSLLGGNLWSDILTQSAPDRGKLFSNIDEYLMTYLGLNPLSNSSSVLELHGIENALSALVATLFWIGGHIEPDATVIKYSALSEQFGQGSHELGTYPILLAGNTQIQQGVSLVRLNISLIAVSLALATSFILMILCISLVSLPASLDNLIEGTGLLHNIWLWRYHPEHSDVLEDVKQPTQMNLRTAGLRVLQLSDGLLLGEGGRGYLPVGKQTKGRRNHIQHSQSDDATSTLFKTTHVYSVVIHHFQLVCISLHVLLVLVHLALLGILLAHREHNIIFATNRQKTVSLWLTITTTAFGTIYYSLLLYLTQKLAITCTVKAYSTLTATHDKVTAWAGIGSALSAIYKQFTWPASFLATVSIFSYLFSISTLTVTTPALFSVETFNSFARSTAVTQTLPEWGDSAHNSTVAFIKDSGGLLPWIGSLEKSKSLGLFNGSLYDVLTQAYPEGGKGQVSAVGFNVTCAYIPDAVVEFLTPGLHSYNISFPSQGTHISPINAPVPNSIMIAPIAGDTIILYTSNAVHDSADRMIPSEAPIPDSDVSLHFLQCSKSLISQTGQVSIDSREIIPSSLTPVVQKTHSAWKAYEAFPTSATNETTLLEGSYWSQIVSGLPLSGISFNNTQVVLSWGDVYLNEQLGLNISTANSSPELLYLDDIENALSRLVASIFWIGGHVREAQLAVEDTESADGKGTVHADPPILATGKIEVEPVVSAARLDLSPLAVSIGLGASIILLFLAVQLSADVGGSDTCLDGLGLLQTIWVFEHHPGLSEILEQVENPSDYNLREAGLVKVRLLDALPSGSISS
ncbi:hypothetical protein DFH09DRAFT_1125418, partial [Mycena vulgaris]